MLRGKWAVVVLAMVLSACSEKKLPVSVGESVASDSVAVNEIGQDEPESMVPQEADELFDDFFFNFASNPKWQLERTVFPLPVFVNGEKKESIAKRKWKTESFFTNQDYYTLIFDTPKQMELVNDTAVAEATVERIDLDKSRVQQFLFSRNRGHWMLHEMRWQPLPHNPNAQFLLFYNQFVSDSLFQQKSLASQIVFSGPDPDDDFSVIEGVITPDFWDAFKPELPQHILYNIVYGHQNPASSQKILLLRGISNGLEVEVTFRLQRGHWKLTRLMN